MSSICIVVILGRNVAFVSGLITAVADIRSFRKASALFQFKIITNLVTDGTGTTESIAKKDFLACIGFSAPKAVDAEVVWVIETTTIPSVGYSVFIDLIRNGGWILAEITGDFPE